MNPPDQPTPTLAPTPRTDTEEQKTTQRYGCFMVKSGFARTLERELTETERLRFGADAERRQLRCDLFDAKWECERLKFALVEWEAKERGWSKAVEKDAAELARLRAENLTVHKMTCSAGLERDSLRAQLAAIEEDGTQEHNAAVSLRLKLVTALDRADNAEADNAKWQKLLLMSRDDREIDLISEIEEQARLLGKSGEREADLLGKLGRLESELAAIKNGHGELGKYEQLRLKNAELQAELAAIKGTP